MALIDDAASRLAKETGMAVEDVRPALRGLSDAKLEEIADASRTSRILGGIGRVAADQPSRAAGTVTENALKAGQNVVLGGGAIAGGTLATRSLAQAWEEQGLSDSVKAISSDPHLNSKEKEELIREVANSGDGGGDGGGGGLLGFLNPLGGGGGSVFSGMGPMEWFVFLIVLYFGGQALTNYADNAGGN